MLQVFLILIKTIQRLIHVLQPFIKVLNSNKNPSLNSFVDTRLLPHTKYEYYVVGENTVGNVSSPLRSAITLMAGPEGLMPPTPTVISANKIAVVWTVPTTPNGRVTEYSLYRIKWTSKEERLVFKGLGLSHLDGAGLEPYTGYLYVISACTNSCTNKSATELVYTQQSIPTKVNAPILIAQSPYTMRVNWSSPLSPNGIITQYNVTMLVNGSYQSVLPEGNLGEMMTVLVLGLKPYTLYTFRIGACTTVGCAVGPDASKHTLQAAPIGVQPPRVVVLNARRVEVEWNEPSVKNGVITLYVLHRNDSIVSRQLARKYIDTSVLPDTYYGYVVEAFTTGGSAKSSTVIISTPESSPEGIPVPKMDAISFSSVNVSWSAPSSPNGVVISYALLYQEVDGHIMKRYAGSDYATTITDLKPFTLYLVRLEACTVIGCGTGERLTVHTLEAAPTGQNPPSLEAKTSRIVELTWNMPSTPNGVITKYQVERLEGLNGLPYIIYVGDRTHYIDTQLKPYTLYKYRVRSINKAGYTESTWAVVKTLEGIPEDINAPKIDVLSSTTVQATWNTPGRPNGVITSYEIRARRFSQTGNETTVKCCISANVLTSTVSGLLPATR